MAFCNSWHVTEDKYIQVHNIKVKGSPPPLILGLFTQLSPFGGWWQVPRSRIEIISTIYFNPPGDPLYKSGQPVGSSSARIQDRQCRNENIGANTACCTSRCECDPQYSFWPFKPVYTKAFSCSKLEQMEFCLLQLQLWECDCHSDWVRSRVACVCEILL